MFFLLIDRSRETSADLAFTQLFGTSPTPLRLAPVETSTGLAINQKPITLSNSHCRNELSPHQGQVHFRILLRKGIGLLVVGLR